MDGTIKALDVGRDGEIAWEANFDAQPLMSGSIGKVQPMSSEGRSIQLVPALDGSLYMYSVDERILEPIPLNTESLLQASLRIGHEAVAGGKVVTTTGVDPVSGKVRYHCSLDQCDKLSTDEAHATLVFRRTGNSIRAMDGLTGSESWNLSIAEYEATLLIKERANVKKAAPRFSYRVSPPEGIITAYDSCGEKWTISVGKHVAHLWEMSGSEIREVSLFESRNIHTLSAEDEIAARHKMPVQETESLFYLGTFNNLPFIIHSPYLKSESLRLGSKPSREFIEGRERQLLPAVRKTYFEEPTTLVDMLSNSYKGLVAKRVQAAENDNNKQVAIRKERDRRSCFYDEDVALIGQSDIRSAKFPAPSDDEATTDDGYFIMRRTSPRQDWLRRSNSIMPNIRRRLRVDENVSGWWRAIALGVTIFGGIIIGALYRSFDRLREYRRRPQLEAIRSPESVETLYPAETPASGSTTATEEVLQRLAPTKSVSTDISSGPAPVTTRSSNQSFTEAPFESKFSQDFEVLRFLGKGGYGVVFSAKNRMDENVYAIKRIAVAQDRAIERVLREEDSDKEMLKALRLAKKNKENGIDEESHQLENISLPPAVGESQGPKREVLPDDPQPSQDTNVDNSMERFNPLRPDTLEPIPSDPNQVSNVSDSGSWLGGDKEGDNPASSSTSSDSSDDERSSGNYKAPLKDESSMIIFGEASTSNRTRQKSFKSTSSQEVSRIEAPAVLITSQDNDLLPSKDREIKSHAYVYIQMQLCQSKTLSDWLKRNSTFDARNLHRMRSWFQQLVEATQYIHEQGMIHRDIKPQNIFFASDDVLKIGDMGLVSKNLSAEDEFAGIAAFEDMRHTGNVGTKSYMSPEQLAHKPYTLKVDVFSLGVVFVEMILPFATAMERLQTLAQLQKGKVPPELDNFPKEKEFVQLLCAKDPTHRPTCSQVLESAYIQGECLRRRRLSRQPSSRHSDDDS
ncbi:unnamed protein product, partial [Mesorhabditis spiculigera]